MPQSGGKLRRSVQTARLCKSRTYPTMQQCGLLRRAKGVHSSFRSGKNDEKSYPACLPDVGDYTLVPCRARRICEVSMVVLVKTTSQVVRSQEFKELAGAACQVASHHTLEEYNAMNRAELFDGITA